jgi:adenylosuccinate synthase
MPLNVVVGAQWGDEGKGKIVDLLAERADVVARYQGGNNAGHTLVIGSETYKLRLVPSGILYPGTQCVLGNGCVIDPEVLIEELDGLLARDIDVSGLRISGNAHLIMPWHRIIDADSELQLGRLQIGTTRRGIGPAYADKALRVGIRVQDLLDEKILRLKIQTALSVKNVELRKLHHHRPLDKDEVTVAMLGYAERIKPFIADTSLLIHRALEDGRSVLCEGAQGTLLDIDHGTYPFVTSSSPIAAGAAAGAGLGPTRISCVLGIAKAYATRVGSGPFPTELPDAEGARLREAGAEFGSVTGRPRRTGWFDLPGFKYAARVNGLDGFALTKLDVLTGLGALRVCVAYDTPEGRTEELPLDAISDDPRSVTPVYEDLPGWTESLRDVQKLSDLPKAAREYVRFIEERSRVPLYLLSVGARRLETIVLKDPFAAVAPGRSS